MDLQQWLVEDFDDVSRRLRDQVLSLVPISRRAERAQGGNSITWSSFHIAYHAQLALSVVSDPVSAAQAQRSALGPEAAAPGRGLQEAEQSWSAQLDAEGVEHYLNVTLDATRLYLSELSPDDLDRTPSARQVLLQEGVPTDEFSWLYRMWQDQPTSFFVRWPLIGHVVSHVGEMLANRSRMGLNPF